MVTGLPDHFRSRRSRQAPDMVASMVERGALAVDIVDACGMHYDLIDLERVFDDETLA